MRGALAAVATLIVGGCLVKPAAPDLVNVDGGQIAGTTVEGVRVFKGIPFAAPPVGELRWKAPQPVVPWTGVKHADAFGPQCMQPPDPGSAYEMAPAPTSEDCLYLNVYSTAKSGERRPVMVWIHGGGWTWGAGSLAMYDGSHLAKKGVVVVAVNYRLGVFGFLAHPELTAESPHDSSGNYAILDHVAALEWVKRNIGAFGGNPANVTIFGESAGSSSVNVLQATPLAKGLFARAIGESGGEFARTVTLATAERAGMTFMKAAGADSLKALRSLPAETIEAAWFFRSAVTVDGWVLPAGVRTIFARKEHNAGPVLVGSNGDEWTTLSDPAQFPKTMSEYRNWVETQYGDAAKDYEAAYPVASDADIAKAMLATGRDQTFTLEMRTWARMVTAAGAKAFLYQFTHVPPSPHAATWGAYHAAEIAYVFGTLKPADAAVRTGQRAASPASAACPACPNGTWPFSDADFKLSDQMSSYWVNFASTGDPNGSGLEKWSPYNEGNEPYLELGDPIQTKHHLLKPQLDFLESIQRPR